MQHQLKACGDGKSASRAHHQQARRSANASTKKSNGSSGAFLATDVTNLEMKKLKRNGFLGSTMPVSNAYLGSQFAANNYNFAPLNNHSALYNNIDIHHLAMGSGDVPSLMSVPAHKPTAPLSSIDPSMDLSQFTEELQAIQNMQYSPLASHAALQAYLANEASSMLLSKSNMLSSSSLRVTGARKNRMVEVQNMNGCLMLVISDPQATASARPTYLELNNVLRNVAQNCLEMTKKRPAAETPIYSRKVFIGGLPIDVPDEEVWVQFGSFGKVLIDWPRRPEHNGRGGDMYDMEMGRRNMRSVSGYVFLVFSHEQSVQDLVNACELYDGKYYLQLSSPTMSDKAVQVRPWKLSDIDYFLDPNALVDPRRTVFIGGVPRPTRACDLAKSLEDFYGKVSYVGIDIDPELKYPKGAARVSFASAQSFVRAISGRFVQVNHAETNKRVEIKPYVMEDQNCDECEGALCKHNYAPYYCGDANCLQYYCEGCWDRMHYEMGQTRADHRPMVRTGDQTRILPRPPHHPTSNCHQRPQHLFHQDHMDNHHSSRSSNTSIFSRIVNRNASLLDHPSVKPFSAIPTSIGY